MKGLSEAGLSGAGYFLLYLAACAALFLLLLWISDKMFYKALLAGQEVYRKRKKLTDVQMRKQYGEVLSPVKALMAREWKTLIRSPLYALNGLAGSLIGPLMVIPMLFARNSDPQIKQLFEILDDPQAMPYIVLGGLGLMLFTAGMNLVASTALSREGKMFWITKSIPVSARQQVTAKFLVGYLISVTGVAVTGILMRLLLNLPLLWVLGAAAVSLAGAAPMVSLNLLLDVFHPKLVWNSEQEAMKQNMNGGIGLLVSLLVLLILGAAAAVLILLHTPMRLVFVSLGALSAIMGVLSIMALFKAADKKYRELEA